MRCQLLLDVFEEALVGERDQGGPDPVALGPAPLVEHGPAHQVQVVARAQGADAHHGHGGVDVEIDGADDEVAGTARDLGVDLGDEPLDHSLPVQALRQAAQAYGEAVREGSFPTSEHSFDS